MSKPMTKFEQLPTEVKPLVAAGWYAVVYKGIQVIAVCPQWVYAEYVIRYCDGHGEIVTKESK